MTAIAIVRGADAIAIASDGAAYTDDGVLMQIVPKVQMYPHLPCVIASRGSQLLPSYFNNALLWTHPPPATFDELLDVAEGLAEEAMEHVRHDSVPSTWPSTLFFCGYSAKRDRLETYGLKTREWEGVPLKDGTSGTAPPFTLVPLPAIHLAPAPPADLAEIFGIVLPADMKEMPDDGATYAMRAVTACRAQPGAGDQESADSDPYCCVGGFLQLTYVNKPGVSSSVVHRWPDELGVRMDVEKGEPHERWPLWLLPRPADGGEPA